MITELLSYPFLYNALIASVLAGIACGIVGTLVVVNRLTFLAGGVAHAAYGGVGLGIYLGLPILPCTILFSLAAALFMARMYQQGSGGTQRPNTDTAVSVLWAAGMAFGIILMELTPGYTADLMSYLFGSLLTVGTTDLYLMLGLDILLIVLLIVYAQGIWAVTIDKGYAEARGLPVTVYELCIIAMTALAVVMLIRVAGLILVLALLTIPPYLAQRFSRSLWSMMASATVLTIIFCLCGLVLGYHADLSSGAAIIAVATTVYLLLTLFIRKQV